MIVFTDESFIFSNYCYKPRCSFFINLGNLTPERNDVTIVVKDNSFENKIIKIAVVGDPHLPENKKALLSFAELMEDIKSAQPDLVVFVGDYTDNPSNISNMSQHRSKIAKTIIF